MLLASELVANSVRHSYSGLPGQTITVTVTTGADGLLVEVADRSGPGIPALRYEEGQAECGRGLQLVTARRALGLPATGWPRTTTWFEVRGAST